MSDHCVLKFTCQFCIEHHKNKDKLKLDKGDYNGLRTFLDINWDNFLLAPDITVDEMWHKFKSVMFQKVHHVSLMLKKFQSFTAQLRTLIHKKHRL